MAEEKKTTLKEANELARTIFNSMPYEQRKRLGAPDDRLREINALIEKGDYLSMAHLKKRKKELEDWLIDWYKEICKKSLQAPETCKENGNSFTSLEEAAENYIAPIENEEGLDYFNFNGRDIKDAFIAGAEWQKEQMGEQARKELFKDDLTLADLVAFDEGFKLGRRLERQDMLKDAVEGVVVKTDKHTSVKYQSRYGTDRYFYGIKDVLFNRGDKVKIVIVKED